MDLIPSFARWMCAVGQTHQIFDDVTAIVPVPLHWKRLFWRQYNQAGLLAQAIATSVKLPYRPEWLRRSIATPPQGNLNKQQRQLNVKGCFQISPSKKLALNNQSILLIDDVLTTGATLTECTRILLRHGIKEVRVLTLARVGDKGMAVCYYCLSPTNQAFWMCCGQRHDDTNITSKRRVCQV